MCGGRAWLTVALAAAIAAPGAHAFYCNAAPYGPRKSKAFPPGWNGLGQKPYMGWRSWYAFFTQMNQSLIEETIDALTARNRSVGGWKGNVSLCDLGYCAVGIDEGWEGCGEGVNGTQHYANGTPATNNVLFPDMKGLVGYGHSHGLKMGWYFNGCRCGERREPARGWDINYAGDIHSLHENGFDAVKFDGCGSQCNLTRYAELMSATTKAYEIENCHWGDCSDSDASSCPTEDWCPFNFYRTSGDSSNKLSAWYDNLQTTIRFQTWDAPVSRPGCWAYPDMLQVGRLGCASQSTSGCPIPTGLRGWTRTHFAAFCIVSSPLVLSIRLTDANLAPILDIIGNKRAIAINQAWAGHPGTLIRSLGPVAAAWQGAGHPRKRSQPLPPDVTCRVGETGGGDLHVANLTVADAITWCKNDHRCSGFTAPVATTRACAPVSSTERAPVYECHFKDAWGTKRPNADKTWSNWLVGGAHAAGGVQLWAKPLGTNQIAVLFINGGLGSRATEVTLLELNITSSAAEMKVTDVWTGAEAGRVVGGRWPTGDVPSMDSRFVVFESV